MTIISSNMLSARLPGTANTDDLSLAINRATGFVNTWAIHYDPFDDFQASPEAILAPAEIGSVCLEIAEAEYYLEIGQVERDGNDSFTWHDFKELKKDELKSIEIAPTWETETISLNSDNVMGLGSRTTTGGMWPRVIPYTAQVISGSTVWARNDDWTIRRGGAYDDEWPDRWYLDANRGSSVTGTIRYMRTYRNDQRDYMMYMGNHG